VPSAHHFIPWVIEQSKYAFNAAPGVCSKVALVLQLDILFCDSELLVLSF